MSIENVTNKDCAGCGACYLICPKSAITVSKNSEGFFAAKVERAKCVGCELCTTVCPRIVGEEGKRLLDGKAIAARLINKKELAKSSSGGLGYAFYEKALAHEWKVIGALYDKEKRIVKGGIAKNKSEMKEFRGSKYLQCDFSETYNNCVKMAEDNADFRFLVIGMPCQIAGLHNLLTQKKLRDRFLLVDMFCHGVPTYQIWDEYCNDCKRKYGAYPEHIDFRSKRFGWGTYCLEYDVKGRHVVSPGARDFFVNAFFDDILLNNSCMDCSYRQEYSAADIRIGDFWGPRFRADTEGVSAALLLTVRGEAFFNSLIGDTIDHLGEFSIEECVKVQSVHPYKTQRERDEAFYELKNGLGIKKVIRNYRRSFPLPKKRNRILKWFMSFLPNGGRDLRGKLLKMMGR